jgi:hypothetical protein
MKKYILLSFLFATIQIFAQQTPPPPSDDSQPNDPPVQMQQQPAQQNINKVNMKNNLKAEKFKNLKIGGIVLLTAGGIGLISGIALVGSGVSNQISTNNQTSTTTTSGTTYTNSSGQTQTITPGNATKIAGGVYLSVFSAFAIGGGTAMAIIGSHKQKKYMAASRLAVFVAPTAFRIAYTF